jgi:hypothetical protein
MTDQAAKPKRKKSEKRQRTEQTKHRWTLSEKFTLAAKASEAGLSVGAYVRAAALGDAGPRSQRRLPINAQLVRQTLGLHGRYGNNMNQIAYELHAHGETALEADFRQALNEWGEIRDLLLEALGRNIQPA